MEQADASPDVARLSDEEETRLSLALASQRERAERARPRLPARCAATRAAASRSWASRASEDDVERRRAARPARCCARAAAWRSARGPGSAWLRGRYHGPYLRDELLDRGVMVETLETADHVERPASGSTRRWATRCAARWRSAARRRS